jgi:RNA polymerase sigma-70 factor (ECF subfamily)
MAIQVKPAAHPESRPGHAEAPSASATVLLRLYAARAEAAVRLAYHLTKDREAALDLSQEAFVKALESLSALQDASRLEAWFDRILANLCRDWLRRRGAERRTLRRVAQETPPRLDLPAEHLEACEQTDRVRAALLELPDELREAVALVCVEGLAPKDAAVVLGLKEGTLRWRVHEGRTRLQAALRRSPGG